MDFTSWCTANNYDEAELKGKQRAHLEAAWKAETQPPTPEPKPQEKPPESGFDQKMAAIEAENDRIAYIQERTAQEAQAHIGNPEKVKQLRELCAAALEDKKMDRRDFDLGLLRAGRAVGPMMISPRRQEATADVLEAAVCMTGRLENLEKHFDPKTLEAAHKQFRGNLGLQDLMMHAARHNGYRGQGSVKSDLRNVFKAAFQDNGDHGMYAGGAVPSTYSLPDILSNVANKFLRVGFESIDTAWRSVAAISTRTDFKTATTVALTGSSVYDELPPSGEIKHGTLGATTYTNRVKTYARMIGIDRQHLINDDLGALTNVGRRIGIDAGRTINYIFWGVFLNNSAFFASGNSNVITGAGSALSSGALKLADAKFRAQTDPDGLPMGMEPSILLVPGTLSYTARELMNSSFLIGSTTANTLLPSQNIFNGAYRVVTSPYMENANLTGYSAAAWYLIASPDVLPVIEIAFLNGKDTPTVETTELDFNMLGMATRAYIDFGVALQEYRGGVRAAGS